MFLLGFLGLRILIQSFPTVIQHSSLYFPPETPGSYCFLGLRVPAGVQSCLWASSTRNWLQTFSHYIIARQCHYTRVKSALKIVFLFSFCSFLSSFPLEVKGKKKKNQISRTIPGRHLGVNQTSSQSKLRFISLHPLC